MNRYRTARVTQDQIDAEVAKIAAQVDGLNFEVTPNGVGHRAECTVCHWSECHGTVQAMADHAKTHEDPFKPGARVALATTPEITGTVVRTTAHGDIEVNWDGGSHGLFYYPSELRSV